MHNANLLAVDITSLYSSHLLQTQDQLSAQPSKSHKVNMHYTAIFAAFAILSSTGFVGAFPHEAPTPTMAAQITSIASLHNCTDTSMSHHRTISRPYGRHNSTMAKPIGRPHPPGCQCPTCMPHPPGCQCAMCTSSKSTGTPHPPGCQCPTCKPPTSVPTISVPVPGHTHRNVTLASKHNCTEDHSSSPKPDLRTPPIARSFESPTSISTSNTTAQALTIKPPVAPKSVHGNTVLAISIAGVSMAVVLVITGVYVWLKKRGKGKGEEQGSDLEMGRVRASRINGEGWEVRKMRGGRI